MPNRKSSALVALVALDPFRKSLPGLVGHQSRGFRWRVGENAQHTHSLQVTGRHLDVWQIAARICRSGCMWLLQKVQDLCYRTHYSLVDALQNCQNYPQTKNVDLSGSVSTPVPPHFPRNRILPECQHPSRTHSQIRWCSGQNPFWHPHLLPRAIFTVQVSKCQNPQHNP